MIWCYVIITSSMCIPYIALSLYEKRLGRCREVMAMQDEMSAHVAVSNFLWGKEAAYPFVAGCHFSVGTE